MDRNDWSRHIISQHASLIEALNRLNTLSGGLMTLFAIDDNDRMCGTLTDGDIRRGLIAGTPIEADVAAIMHRQFRYLTRQKNNFEQLRSLRRSRIELIPMLDDEHRIVDIIDLRHTVNILPLDAILMAGGRGERLRPLTLDTPKPLLKVGDKAIIDYNIDALIRNGIDNIFVTVNYLHEKIEQHFATPRNGVQVKCVLEPQRMGTIGSASLCTPLKNDNVLLMNSDLLTTLSFEDMLAWHLEHKAALTMAVIPYTVSVPYAILQTEGDSVKGMTEKPSYNYFANAGIYIINRSCLEKIDPTQYLDAPDFIESLIGEGKKVSYFPIEGTWIDIGSPNDFKYANSLMNRPQ